MNSNRPIHFWVPNLFEFKGGIQTYLLDILSSLEKHFPDQRVEVFDKLDKTYPEDKFSFANFHFSCHGNQTGMAQSFSYFRAILQAVLLGRPGLILCGHINFAPVALWVNQLLGIPYWVIVYGRDVWQLQNKQKIKALARAEKIISISDYTTGRLVKECALPADKFLLLPCTLNAARFSIAPKPNYLLERHGLRAEQPVILTVARLDETEKNKGYDKVVQAMVTIRQHLPEAHYILVGKGPDAARIATMVADLNLKDSVTLTGFIPDEELGDYYNLCDVFALPSKKEGFGIVYLEALACGKPVLGGNQDAAVGTLLKGKLGALVNPDSVADIAQTLVDILQGRYPNSLMYQPEQLRQQVMDTYGLERFQNTLKDYLDKFFRDEWP